MDDFELLQSYASRKAEDAFRSLTERYVNIVYSAAVRQTGNAEAAKDVTQAVFLTLARKAGGISRNTVLAGWLLRTTRYAAANARRLEQRRQHYEHQAMQSPLSGVDATWQRIAPLLDEALDDLAEKDRDAVVLRFFEQMPLKRVAQKLGVSEDGAQKRVSRALDKLRMFLARRGRTVTVGAMASALTANCVQAAPAAIMASVGAAVVGTGALTGSIAAAVTHATLRAIAQARLRLVAVRAGSAAILLGVAALVVLQPDVLSTRNTPAAATPAVVAPVTKASTRLVERAFADDAATITPLPNLAELLLRVVDAQTARPVENALLELVSTEGSQRTTNAFRTDVSGAARIAYSPLAGRSWSHRIEIFRDGYVPKYLSWSEYQQDQIDEIPADYTVRLDPAVAIGGLVLDERDVPVPAARVMFSVSGPIPHRARERLTMMGDYHSEVTGKDGRWTCSHVPARFGMISFKPVHPLFQEKRWVTDSPDATSYVAVDKIPEADFLAGRALMRLIPGLTIAGFVTDSSGQPVAGARVTRDFDFHGAERNLATDGDGTFEFGNGRPGKLSLTVQAAAFAPVVTSMVLNASIKNIRVILPEARTLRGRIVDDAENPVSGATVEAASPSNDSRKLFQWRTRTDAAGRFVWEAAPAVQEYAVSASGYETQSRLELNADGDEQTIRLARKTSPTPVRIDGEVLDATTKQPAKSVRVQIWETHKEPGGGFATFTTVAEDASRDGKFRLKTSPGTVKYILEVQADGYWPERLTNQVTGELEVKLHIELVPAPLVAGIVLTPTGEPAAGATLVVCGLQKLAQMNHPGKLVTGPRGSGTTSVVADAQGRFRLPNEHAPEVVVVAHPLGFGEVPFSQMTSATAITLQPWGRIEGTALAGHRPLVQETIRLTGMQRRTDSYPRVSVYLAATTDAEGRFVFDTVPPGEWKVQRELNKFPSGTAGIRFPAYSHGVPLQVGAGETATVTLGGAGQPIIGRVVSADSIGADVWTENSIALILKVPSPDAPHPPQPSDRGSSKESQAANHAYLERSLAYWNSDTGLAQRRLQREYRAMFAADGTFRIDDVPPGDYTVKVNLSKPAKSSEGNPPNVAPIASFETDMTIPAAVSPSDDTPVNLGVLQLSPSAPQRPGR